MVDGKDSPSMAAKARSKEEEERVPRQLSYM